jgi:glutamate-1-semialdehyde aminotransferase
VPKFISELILEVKYNDLNHLEDLLKKNKGEVAGVMIEAIQGDGPSDDYFPNVRRLCDEHECVFILDEVKTGFRFDLGGAQKRFNIDPDVSCFGKAMCNGYPGSAVVGKKHVMKDRADTHMAATFHGDLLSTVAALATIDEMEKHDGIGHFWRLGQKLLEGLQRVFDETDAPLRATGYAPMPAVMPRGELKPGTPPNENPVLQFCAAMQRRGIYIVPHPWFLCLEHTEADVAAAIDAAYGAVSDTQMALIQAGK